MSWDELVKGHLLSTGYVTGVAVISLAGSCTYHCGVLETHQDQDWGQFSDIFSGDSTTVPKLSLRLSKEIPFVVFQRTHCSLYATSAGSMYGLIVCSFPLGLLVCVTEPPTPMNTAVSTVEKFCTLIRR